MQSSRDGAIQIKPYNIEVTTHYSIGPEPQREASMRTIEDLRGPAGRLEAILNTGRTFPDQASGVAGGQDAPVSVLLCHPHPLYGGTLHNKVVYYAMKTFTNLGLPVLRFNFRGAGRSEGAHDGGIGEQDDVRAGIEWLAAAYSRPVLAAGFSFGAHMALRASCPDSRVCGLVSLGTPVAAANRTYTYEFLKTCDKPKLFISGAADEFGPVAQVEKALEHAAEDKTIVWIPDADHFFVGRLEQMQQALHLWMQAHFVPHSLHQPVYVGVVS